METLKTGAPVLVRLPAGRVSVTVKNGRHGIPVSGSSSRLQPRNGKISRASPTVAWIESSGDGNQPLGPEARSAVSSLSASFTASCTNFLMMSCPRVRGHDARSRREALDAGKPDRGFRWYRHPEPVCRRR